MYLICKIKTIAILSLTNLQQINKNSISSHIKEMDEDQWENCENHLDFTYNFLVNLFLCRLYFIHNQPFFVKF